MVFSHLNAIMYWTLMNAKNAKNSLLTSHPLPNTGRVVITGNPVDRLDAGGVGRHPQFQLSG